MKEIEREGRGRREEGEGGGRGMKERDEGEGGGRGMGEWDEEEGGMEKREDQGKWRGRGICVCV